MLSITNGNGILVFLSILNYRDFDKKIPPEGMPTASSDGT
jgi:hypothetical protein